MTILAPARAKGVGNQRVQSDEKASTEKGQHVEEIGADADGADGGGAVRQAADHHGVHDAHGHPADFGENQREGEAERGAKFGAEIVGDASLALGWLWVKGHGPGGFQECTGRGVERQEKWRVTCLQAGEWRARKRRVSKGDSSNGTDGSPTPRIFWKCGKERG